MNHEETFNKTKKSIKKLKQEKMKELELAILNRQSNNNNWLNSLEEKYGKKIVKKKKIWYKFNDKQIVIFK